MADNYIKKIEIERFIGGRDLDIEFDRDVNFLIGRNGSGKTTFIRCVNAILSGDIAEIARQRFLRAKITFASTEHRRHPSVEVHKKTSGLVTEPEIIFSIRESQSAEPIKYAADIRPYHVGFFSDDEEEEYEYEYGGPRKLRAALGEMLDHSWLPLDRAGKIVESDGETFNPIDYKIREISVRMGRYFTGIDTNYSGLTKQFQQEYFLSLLNFRPSVNNALKMGIIPLKQGSAL